ncbi:DcrB-related protein [Candidatus Peregrinibacteria bacterium]|nr:DcrB-related protein [Candidatus Peregrinibacteria bacterium]
MQKHLFLVVAILVLLPLGVVITQEVLSTHDQDLWDATVPTLSKESRSGKRREFTKFKDYASIPLKFSIKIPEDWTVEEEGNGVYFLSVPEGEDDKLRENINVIREELSTDKSLDDYTEDAINQIKDLENYTLVGSQDITIDGLPGKTVVYTALVQNTPLEFQQAWTVKDGTAYLLTLATVHETFPEHAVLFVRMVNSMDLK